MDKVVSIEKHSYQEELIQPLFDKVIAMRNWPELFFDEYCNQIKEMINYDFSDLESKKNSRATKNAALYTATRQYAFAMEIKKYLEEHPKAVVVTLECGLDATSLIVDNGQCRTIAMDTLKFIEVREKLMPTSSKHKNQPINIKERLWYDKVDYNPEEGAIFILSRTLVYWKEEDVRRFINEMSKRFRGATFVFDSLDKYGRDEALKDLKKSGIEIKDNFCLDNPKKKIATYSRFLESIECKPMFSGYKSPDRKIGLMLKMAMSEFDSTTINILKFKDPVEL